MEGVQDVGMRPGEGLGGDLVTVDFVNLFIDSASIGLDVVVDSSHDRVSSILGRLDEVSSSCSRLKVEEIHPGFVISVRLRELEVSDGFNLSLHGLSSLVEELSFSGREKLPRVSVCVVVTRVSSDKDTGNLFVVV